MQKNYAYIIILKDFTLNKYICNYHFRAFSCLCRTHIFFCSLKFIYIVSHVCILFEWCRKGLAANKENITYYTRIISYIFLIYDLINIYDIFNNISRAHKITHLNNKDFLCYILSGYMCYTYYGKQLRICFVKLIFKYSNCQM